MLLRFIQDSNAEHHMFRCPRLFWSSESRGTSPKALLLNTLREHGIELYKKHGFAMRKDTYSTYQGGTFLYFARRSKRFKKGFPVIIKLLDTTREACEVDRLEFDTFKLVCLLLKRIGNHPNIQKFVGVVETFYKENCIGMVCNDVSVGDLGTFAFNDERAKIPTKLGLMRDVATALAFLHERKIQHGNIRAETILIDLRDGNLIALLSNFGCAIDFSNSNYVDTLPGSNQGIYWKAPESDDDVDYTNIFNNGTGDIWSFGSTLIEILALTKYVWSSHRTGDVRQYFCDLKSGKLKRPDTFPPWDEAWNFIYDRCLDLVPSQRITAKEVIGELGRLLDNVPEIC